MNCIDVNHSVVEFLSRPDQLNLPKIVVAAKISLWQEDQIKEEDKSRFPTKEELLNDVEPVIEVGIVENPTLSLDAQRQAEIDKATSDWSKAKTPEGYPEYALAPILEAIDEKYKALKETKPNTQNLSAKERMAAALANKKKQ